MVRLILNNYRHVSFSTEHLDSRLDDLLKGDASVPMDLHGDEILGTFLRQFGDREITDKSIIGVALQWWSTLINRPITAEIKRAIIRSVSYAFAQRRQESVLGEVSSAPYLAQLGFLWAAFVIGLYRDHRVSEIAPAWSLISSVAEDMFPADEATHNELMWTVVPLALMRLIEQGEQAPGDKQAALALISLALPSSDGLKLQERIVALGARRR